MNLSADQLSVVACAINQAQQRASLPARIRAVYDEVQRAVDARKPRCDVSGRCCQFEQYGHLLFVTTIELAAFALERRAADDPHVIVGDGCPYQVNRLCTVHDTRPFGCRIYFCDPTAQEWQQSQYEQFHLRIRALHDELAIPYFYVEWRQGLEAIAIAGRVQK